MECDCGRSGIGSKTGTKLGVKLGADCPSPKQGGEKSAGGGFTILYPYFPLAEKFG